MITETPPSTPDGVLLSGGPQESPFGGGRDGAHTQNHSRQRSRHDAGHSGIREEEE